MIRRDVDRAEANYKSNLRKSTWDRLCNPKKKVKPPLKSSYIHIREEDLKWNKIDTIDYTVGMNFVSGGIRDTNPTSEGIEADAKYTTIVDCRLHTISR